MTKEEILEWVAEVFEEPSDAIQPESTADDIPAWDSLGVLNLMAAFDEDFDIQLSDDELQQLKTVGDIIELFKRYGHL
jgi:acyl carrier protein